jgi:hypothetical protein
MGLHHNDQAVAQPARLNGICFAARKRLRLMEVCNTWHFKRMQLRQYFSGQESTSDLMHQVCHSPIVRLDMVDAQAGRLASGDILLDRQSVCNAGDPGQQILELRRSTCAISRAAAALSGKVQ